MANSTLNRYAQFFTTWQVNVLGPKPGADLLEQVEGLGLRQGKQALACAMSLRDCGVTGPQIVIACGAPQLNRMRGLVAEGMFKRLPVPANGAGHTVYKNTVTPKGLAEIKRIAKVTANATASTAAPKVVKVSRKANKAAEVGIAAVAAAVTTPQPVDPLALPASLKRDPAGKATA